MPEMERASQCWLPQKVLDQIILKIEALVNL
jgi:hypothetical protein